MTLYLSYEKSHRQLLLSYSLRVTNHWLEQSQDRVDSWLLVVSKIKQVFQKALL